MKITKKTIIGELVAENYAFASVFEKHHVDFYIHGARSIATASKESKLDSNQLLKELESIEQKNIESEEDYKNWSLDKLANHIETTHHRFTEAKITELKPLLTTLVEKYYHTNPEVIELQEIFDISAGDMASHMKKEELVLFPFIRKMMQTKKSQTQITTPHFGTVQNPVNMMLHEHDEQSKLLRKMIALTDNYTLPKDACETFKTAYKSLKAFDTDMHKHLHLENNILFPKAIALEKTLNKL